MYFLRRRKAGKNDQTMFLPLQWANILRGGKHRGKKIPDRKFPTENTGGAHA
jgi:hypothetical protein